jgi:hypothetical protein
MERVAFLVEDTGERIPCLLNPESLVVRRSAALRRATSTSGTLTGTDLADDPVIATGGGRTELELDLLFDTSLLDTGADQARLTTPGDPAPEPPSFDVRDLTRPLWQLAENASPSGSFGGPPLVRFVWGKAWMMLGVITAVAERVEHFGPDGNPNRSWLRVRMLRVGEPMAGRDTRPASPQAIAAATSSPAVAPPATAAGPADVDTYEVVGDERPDVIAAQVYGKPWLWRFIADRNPSVVPPFVSPGTVLQVPPVPPLPEPQGTRQP